ncbi:DUF502 domain-containing protein [Candidatus Neomarinimicrobiota bacterium]
MGAKLRRIFIAGILTAVPVYITIKVLQVLFRFMDEILAPLVRRYSTLDIPGLGLLLLVIFLFILGLFVTNFLGRALYGYFERVLLRIPVVSNVYNFAKQIVQTFSPEHRSAFKKVVWLQYPRPGLWTLGFVTGTSFSNDGVPHYNIFVATTPNPTSGYVVFVPQSDTIQAKLTVEEGFKLLISGGALSKGKHSFLYMFEGSTQVEIADTPIPTRLSPGKTPLKRGVDSQPKSDATTAAPANKKTTVRGGKKSAKRAQKTEK